VVKPVGNSCQSKRKAFHLYGRIITAPEPSERFGEIDGRLKNEVMEDIQQHLEERTEALVAEALSHSEAKARRSGEFGKITLIQEQSRERHGIGRFWNR
jgi:hypothetical protein